MTVGVGQADWKRRYHDLVVSKMIEPNTQRMASTLRTLFDRQQQEVLSKLPQLYTGGKGPRVDSRTGQVFEEIVRGDKVRNPHIRLRWGPPGKRVYRKFVVRVRKDMVGTLLPENEWRDAFANSTTQYFETAYVSGADAVSGALGVSFEMSYPQVEAFVRDKSRNFAAFTNATTRNALRREIRDAIRLGEGIPEVQSRVEKVFGWAKNYRAERIARTEMTRASNQGTLEGMRQSGIVEGKEWIAAADCCELCAAVASENAVKPLDEVWFDEGTTFTAGDRTLTFSYEAIDCPPLHPNCRCAIVPVLQEFTVGEEFGEVPLPDGLLPVDMQLRNEARDFIADRRLTTSADPHAWSDARREFMFRHDLSAYTNEITDDIRQWVHDCQTEGGHRMRVAMNLIHGREPYYGFRSSTIVELVGENFVEAMPPRYVEAMRAWRAFNYQAHKQFYPQGGHRLFRGIRRTMAAKVRSMAAQLGAEVNMAVPDSAMSCWTENWSVAHSFAGGNGVVFDMNAVSVDNMFDSFHINPTLNRLEEKEVMVFWTTTDTGFYYDSTRVLQDPLAELSHMRALSDYYNTDPLTVRPVFVLPFRISDDPESDNWLHIRD